MGEGSNESRVLVRDSVNDEVANRGRTAITTAYTEDMLSRERTMDCIIKHNASLTRII